MTAPHIVIWTPVQPTESADRVAAAVHQLFPTAACTVLEGALLARSRSLDHLSEHLHRQRILDTARTAIEISGSDTRLRFRLNKQAAFVDLLNFAVGTPPELGVLEVVVHLPGGGADALLDSVAPPTADGVPLSDTSDAE
jgi:predicted RNA binding protein with dsRBD fold (UPF0201 family)